METEAGQLRNLRDFLMVYNRMTEICFGRCSSNFNYRSLTLDEERCVDSCAGKLIRSNHRLMGTYVQLMPKMVQKRMDEMEAKVAENAKAAEAAAGAPAVGEELGVPAAAEGSPPEPQIPIITPSPSSETTPALISPSVTEVGLVQLAADATGQLACMPEQVSPPSSFVLGGEAAVIPEVASGPLLTPTPLDVSTELRPVGSASTTAVQPVTESKMAAATLLTPVMDTVNVNGPGVTAFLPLETPPTVTELPPLVAGVQVESGSSVPPASVQPMLTPPTPVASPVSTISVPIMSKATEIVTVPERPQEVPPAADK